MSHPEVEDQLQVGVTPGARRGGRGFEFAINRRVPLFMLLLMLLHISFLLVTLWLIA
jgi:hypothetical protein